MSGIKPIAWFTEDHLTDRSATTYDIYIVERWINKGWPVTALVLHSDHEAEIARLRAEVEGLRTVLEVIAVGDSRTPHIDAAQALLRSGYWADEVDAAMGASA